MSVAPITRLGRYEIRSLLGAGGMGEVYLADDTQLPRKVAIKLLPADLSADRDSLMRFEREAYAASSLNHPNILTIYEIGEQHGHHFIATEYVEGESLGKHLRAPMELKEILDVASQVASALAATHQAGIVHRDIKPDNIMLTRDGFVKVLDFGIAKLTGSETPAPNRAAVTTPMVTQQGAVIGTVSYMSPEQARGTEVDARTDIWSLGVVIYEMVAGRLPFEGTMVNEVIALILGKEPPALARYAPEVPAELERIVTKALKKNREERYQGVKDLALDLKSLKQRREFEAELERTGSTARSSEGARVAPLDVFRTTSNAEVGIRSIAVLPFANMSKDPDTEYLSDGISDSLINRLSQLPGVKVIARTSSFTYKGKEIDPQEVAKTLGVRAIVTGWVTQRGDSLQVSAELVDTNDRTQIWGDQYNRKAVDLLAVQSEISLEIAEKLRLRLSTGEQQQLVEPETANPQAYELALKGRFYWRKGGAEDLKKAVDYFQQAIALDPNYALAYAELSTCYSILAANGILTPRDATPKAEEAVRKALELDESLADAHDALGRLRQNALDWPTAERELRRALELNPNLPDAHNAYALYLSSMKRPDQAIAENKRARELDPLKPSFNTNVGLILYMARRYDEAIEALKKTLELEPTFHWAHTLLGYPYAAKGMYREAIASYQEAIKAGDESSSTQIFLGAAHAGAGEREPAQAILKQLQTREDYVSPCELAILYAALGELEQAFASLEQAVAAREPQLQYLGVDPAFDSLRSDPRFTDLLRRVGLPE